MAITIVTEPYSNVPAQPENLWKVTSTNVAQPNFKFIADVYKNGSLLLRVKRSPALDSAGYFDFGQIMFDQLAAYPNYLFDNIGDLTSWTCQGSHDTFQIKFGEEYGSTPAIYADLTLSSDKIVFFGDLFYNDYVNYSAPSYLFTSPAATNWQHLTNAPLTSYVSIGQSQYVSLIRDTAAIDRFEVVTYLSDGTIEGTHVIDFNNDGPTPTVPPWNLLTFKVGPEDLNNINSNYYISSYVNPIITDDTYKYTIQVQNSANADVGELRTFIVDRNCTKDFTDIAFLNDFGVFEVYRFKGINTPETNYNKFNWRSKRAYNDTTPSLSDVFTQTARVIRSESFEVQSGWVKEDEAAWLKELVGTRQAYISEGGTPVAIVIENTGYNAMTRKNKRLYNFALKYRLSY